MLLDVIVRAINSCQLAPTLIAQKLRADSHRWPNGQCMRHGTALALFACRGGTMYDARMHGDYVVPKAPDRRLTYEDFLNFPSDDGLRHEIIDGKHYVTLSPNTRHQVLVGRLYLEIGLYLRQHASVGQIFLSPLDVVFTTFDIVEPDLLFVAADQADILTEQNVQGAPALVIEILSRGTRKKDEQIKRQLFERTAVREYWIVDPERDQVVVFARQEDGSFPRVAMLSRDHSNILTTRLMPGLSIQLTEFFARP